MSDDKLKERADELIDHLKGTCLYFHALLEDDEDEDALIALVEEEIFECEGCGWWCENDELNNDGDRELCNDCHEDHEHDEDEG